LFGWVAAGGCIPELAGAALDVPTAPVVPEPAPAMMRPRRAADAAGSSTTGSARAGAGDLGEHFDVLAARSIELNSPGGLTGFFAVSVVNASAIFAVALRPIFLFAATVPLALAFQ
jgi:hypothetical protein